MLNLYLECSPWTHLGGRPIFWRAEGLQETAQYEQSCAVAGQELGCQVDDPFTVLCRPCGLEGQEPHEPVQVVVVGGEERKLGRRPGSPVLHLNS